MRSNSRPERAGDRLPERGLADAGRADEEQDRAARVGLQAADREELEDAVLDALEAVVVVVEHLARVGEVEVVLGRLAPRQRDDPLQPAADDAVLGGGLRQALQARELAVGLRADRLGQVDPASCSRSSSTSASAGVALAELLLDGAQLLAQDELALRAVDLALDLGLDPRADLDDLELAGEDLGDAPQPQRDVGLLEQRLLLLGLEPQRAGDEVRQRAGVVDVRDGDLQLLGQVRQRLDDLPNVVWTLRTSAVSSADSTAIESGSSSTSASRYGCSLVQPVTRTRWPACTRIRRVPSGALSIRAMTPTTPTS
jgi:hypothetical protein